ncbi:hypothetical protein K501DRAFT_270770 [Backusella circina FSU 941]|nr:hypothetical protein K501DRAFT_270770 [Backusella circina FSU 941]
MSNEASSIKSSTTVTIIQQNIDNNAEIKLHPKNAGVSKSLRTARCLDPIYVSFIYGRASNNRDQMSAASIGISVMKKSSLVSAESDLEVSENSLSNHCAIIIAIKKVDCLDSILTQRILSKIKKQHRK